MSNENLTEKTLADVQAGIPARDAEIEALRKEIEILRGTQGKTDQRIKVCQGKNCNATAGQEHSNECIVEAAESQGWAYSPEAEAARLAMAKPDFFTFVINGTHRDISETEPPHDSYDEGSLIPLYKAQQPVSGADGLPEGWKVVPIEPTRIMTEAAKAAYMPFGDMEIALRCAIMSAPTRNNDE